MLTMQQCPRYLNCGAPVCPLDPDWAQRDHLSEDRVCAWLTELAKPGGLVRIAAELGEETAARVAEVSSRIAVSSYAIRHRLQRAALSGSRLETIHLRVEKARQARLERGAGVA